MKTANWSNSLQPVQSETRWQLVNGPEGWSKINSTVQRTISNLKRPAPGENLLLRGEAGRRSRRWNAVRSQTKHRHGARLRFKRFYEAQTWLLFSAWLFLFESGKWMWHPVSSITLLMLLPPLPITWECSVWETSIFRVTLLLWWGRSGAKWRCHF